VPTLYPWGDSESSVGRVAANFTADHVKGPTSSWRQAFGTLLDRRWWRTRRSRSRAQLSRGTPRRRGIAPAHSATAWHRIKPRTSKAMSAAISASEKSNETVRSSLKLIGTTPMRWARANARIAFESTRTNAGSHGVQVLALRSGGTRPQAHRESATRLPLRHPQPNLRGPR